MLRKTIIAGVHGNQDEIWLVKIREYVGFVWIACTDYYAPPLY